MTWLILLLLVLIIVLQIMMGRQILNGLKWRVIEENKEKTSPSSVESDDSDDSDNAELNKKWQEEVKRTVQLQSMAVRNAVQKQIDELHAKEIQYCPRSLSIPVEELNKVYSEEQIATLENYWSNYHHYIKGLWLTNKGTIRTVFSQKDALRIKQESQQLAYHLNEQLQDIMTY